MENTTGKKVISLALAVIMVFSMSIFTVFADSSEAAAKNYHSLYLTGVNNARDLGGYSTEQGTKVASGKLLRSGHLADATESDINKLANVYGVSKIIDFRTLVEATADEDVEIGDAENIRMSAIDVTTTMLQVITLVSEIASGTATIDVTKLMELISIVRTGVVNTLMVDQYEGLVTDPASIIVYRLMFNELLESDDQTVLLHCTSGKDRTGVASALILTALGVDEETVKADFMSSNVYYADKIQQVYDKTYEITKSKTLANEVSSLFGVDESWIDAVFSKIDSTYLSMDLFLRIQMGLSSSDLAKLRAIYTY